MREKYADLLKNLGLFFIAGFLPNALAFCMIPIYTSCLSVEDYGTADILTNTIQLLMPVLTLQIQDAVMRYAMDFSYEREDVFSVGIKIAGAGFMLLSGACVLLGLSGVLVIEPVYLMFFLLNYLTGSLNNIFSFFCRGIGQVKALTIGSILNMVISVCCNLLFLLCFHFGLYGYLAANSLGMIACVLYIFIKAHLKDYLRLRTIKRSVAKDMTAFSFPLIFSALSWWVNNASDKYVLCFFCGISTVGVYAAAYKIPTILKVFGDVISMAYSISAIKEFDPKDKDGFIGKSYSMISLFMTLSCSALMLCNIIIARILFAGEFFEAWKYVPPLLISVLMNQMSVSCENILVGAKKTKIISQTAVIGAGINTAANFILIPVFGAYGAGVATAAGFTCFWALRYKKLKNIVALKNNFRKECASYALLGLQAVIAYWGNRFWYLQVFLLLGIAAIYRKELYSVLMNCAGKHI